MPIKPIIAGVDGSAEATAAAITAWRLAVALDVPLELVYAVPDIGALAAISQVPIAPSLRDDVLVEARIRMTRELATLLPAAALTGLRVAAGAADAVLAQAGAGARLVVIGGKHHGPFARRFGGSTAHDLIRTLDVPVLVTAGIRWPLRRVLAAVDLSFAAEPTLDAAHDLARLTGARLRMLHVIEPVPVPRLMAPDFDMNVIAQRAADDFNRRTARFSDVATADRVTRRGLAVDMIVAEAADWKPDLIVMGSQGRGWFDRLVVGSVTEAVLNQLPAGLLVIPVHRVQSSSALHESPTGASAVLG